jgi:hypothetical protein
VEFFKKDIHDVNNQKRDWIEYSEFVARRVNRSLRWASYLRCWKKIALMRAQLHLVQKEGDILSMEPYPIIKE